MFEITQIECRCGKIKDCITAGMLHNAERRFRVIPHAGPRRIESLLRTPQGQTVCYRVCIINYVLFVFVVW